MSIDLASFTDIDAVAADASGALDRARQPRIFDRIDWFRLLLSHCPPPGTPLILRARRGDSAAWLFLTVEGREVSALANWYTLDFGPVLAGPHATSLVSPMLDYLRRYHSYILIDLAPLSEERNALFEPSPCWIHRPSNASVNWSIDTRGADWATYWQARPGPLRTTLARRQASVATQVMTRFDAGAWHAYERIYRQSWKPEEGSPAFLRALAEQNQQHRHEHDNAEQIAAAAETYAAEVRIEVLVPLVEQATADGEAFLASLETSREAHRLRPGRFGKRVAERTAREASASHHAIEQEVRDRWGNTPQTATSLPRWAQAVANDEADRDDRVVEVTHQAAQARRALSDLNQRQLSEHADLAARLLGTARRPADQVKRLRQRTEQARAYLDRIESLPLTDAARLIRHQHERVAAEHAAAEAARRQAQARAVSPSRPDPDRDHGRSL